MQFTWVQKLSIGTGAALGLLALMGFVSYVSIHQMIGGQQAVAATNANIARLDVVVGRTVDAENAQRGYVSTGNDQYLEPLDDAFSDVEDAIQGLNKATEDNPVQRSKLDSLGVMISRRFKEINAVIAIRKRLGADSAAKAFKSRSAVRGRDGIGPLASRMREVEFRMLGERTRAMNASGTSALRVILGGSVFAFVMALFALQPLRPSVERRLTQRFSQVLVAPLPELQLTMSEEARHAGDRLVRLQQVIAALNGPATRADVAQALLSRGAPPLVASLGLVAAGDSDALTVLRALGGVVPHLAVGSVVPSNLAGPLAAALQTREPVVIESRAERSGRFPGLARFSESGTSDGAFVAVPLVEDENVHGVLLLAFSDNRVFSDDERAYLATLGRLGGQALARTVATEGS
ncbi:MAG: CHASE3 domain-containing protein [Gemmatimonadaceae bacterium]